MTFERATGRAQTVQPVTFTFPEWKRGRVGAVYHSDTGQVKWCAMCGSEVQPQMACTEKKGKTSRPAGGVARQQHGIRQDKAFGGLQGPARRRRRPEQLKAAGEFTMLLDAEFSRPNADRFAGFAAPAAAGDAELGFARRKFARQCTRTS